MSGCSGGGKSTLLAELARRGFSTVPEPGRRIVTEELRCNGNALPWTDMATFARRAIAMALADRLAAESRKALVFFDRGLVDAAVALEHATGERTVMPLGTAHRYNANVFLAPPWSEIHVHDAERRLEFTEAVAEYARLERAYRALGYTMHLLSRVDVEARADFVLATLGAAPPVAM
ncbi:AAA family ATPase [Sphingomonas sp. JC676]|uniref:AAA family ATPase n=1 Tax=Sphingomonas sp. JC676 TaxID=2768065 RepID=UPI00292A5A44|nr:AAA family ATPase [Sphingomonas sp. JC676]